MWDNFHFYSSLLGKPHSEGSWKMESGIRVVSVKHNGIFPHAEAHKRLLNEPVNGSSIKPDHIWLLQIGTCITL